MLWLINERWPENELTNPVSVSSTSLEIVFLEENLHTVVGFFRVIINCERSMISNHEKYSGIGYSIPVQTKVNFLTIFLEILEIF